MIKGAEFSGCGKYRYVLWRIWDETKPYACCIGLNPSKANSEKDDPTITTLIKALGKLGYGGLKMVNLFSCITPKPKEIFNFPNPDSPHYAWINTSAATCQDVIFCWGTFKQASKRSVKLKEMFPDAKCFGFNSDGSPMHPMFLMYSGAINNPQLHRYALR